MGIKDGAWVGLMLGNVPDFVILALALSKLDAAIVPIDPTTGARELELMLTAAPLRALVTRPRGSEGSITASGQVVRSPIDANFTPKGRITQGVRFVSLRGNDTVAVVARSVEARDADEEATESPDEAPDATIGGTDDGTAAVEAPPGESES